MEKTFFFDSWQDMLQILVTVPAIYFFIVLAIRVAGKRSTSQMNNFDWIVTVAIGSIAASGMMLKEVAISETFLAISLLLLLQYALTAIIRKYKPLQHIVKARPTLLVRDGEFIEDNMRQERISEGEVRSALRNAGLTKVQEARWVILEPDASLSVIPAKETAVSESDLREIET